MMLLWYIYNVNEREFISGDAVMPEPERTAARGPAPSYGIEGRVVIVTGASSGLGAELAEGLTEAGAHVVAAARRAERLQALEERVDGVTTVVCDVQEAADRTALIEAAVGRFGSLDGLVNNAGVTTVTPALKEDLETFRRTVETNLIAPFALSQLAAETMKRIGGGSIVNVASIMAFHSVPEVPEAGYVASKAGLLGLTRELASQWARYGIRVNALAPGFIPSEITTVDDESAPPWLVAGIPLGRLGTPSEITAATAFLLGPHSSYVTGSVITIDGGMATR